MKYENSLELGEKFIWENARLLERVIYECRFQNGQASRILDVLRTYQNPDGGFGHALEPDLRAPDSQPLFVEFALMTLYQCRLRQPELAYQVCDFLAKQADLKKGIPALLPSSQNYSRAGHWQNPRATEPHIDTLVGLVGLASWQGVDHPWLKKAVEACLEYVSTTPFQDAHMIQYAFCLIESAANKMDITDLHSKLAGELFNANWFILKTPITEYGLTPLDFAPFPDSYCRSLFTDAVIEAHLQELEAKQDADGGWPILWQPPSGAARSEWRAAKTLEALSTLRAYQRI